MIPPPLLGEILTALEQRYGIAAGAEISMEADPGACKPRWLYVSLTILAWSSLIPVYGIATGAQVSRMADAIALEAWPR